MAIDRAVGAAFAPRDDGRFRVHAAAFEQDREVPIAELTPGRPAWAE
jgi:hypothetical protein